MEYQGFPTGAGRFGQASGLGGFTASYREERNGAPACPPRGCHWERQGHYCISAPGRRNRNGPGDHRAILLQNLMVRPA